MELLFGQDRTAKTIALSLLTLALGLIIGLLTLITGSVIVAVLLLLLLLYLLLRTIATFIMYPGSSFLTRSDIELRMSREISNRMVIFFNSLHFLHLCVAQKKYVSHQNQFDLVLVISNHITMMIDMLAMFEGSLSVRKLNMLALYRSLQEVIEEKEEGGISIADILLHPRVIDTLDEQAVLALRGRFEGV
jgi:hypothetical protein